MQDRQPGAETELSDQRPPACGRRTGSGGPGKGHNHAQEENEARRVSFSSHGLCGSKHPACTKSRAGMRMGRDRDRVTQTSGMMPWGPRPSSTMPVRPRAWPWRGADGWFPSYRSARKPAIPNHSPQDYPLPCLLEFSTTRENTPHSAEPAKWFASPVSPLTLSASPPSPLPSDCPPCSYPVPPWTAVAAFLSRTFRVQTPQVLSLCIRTGKGQDGSTSSQPSADTETPVVSTIHAVSSFLHNSAEGFDLHQLSRPALPCKASFYVGQPLGLSLCVRPGFPKPPFLLRRVLEANQGLPVTLQFQ